MKLLWNFASVLQHMTDEQKQGCIKIGDGTLMPSGKMPLAEIMDMFGYDVVKVQ